MVGVEHLRRRSSSDRPQRGKSPVSMIAGDRILPGERTRRATRRLKNAPEAMTSASTRCPTNCAKAASISASLSMFATMAFSPIACDFYLRRSPHRQGPGGARRRGLCSWSSFGSAVIQSLASLAAGHVPQGTMPLQRHRHMQRTRGVSLDHLVGKRQQFIRHRKIERLRSFKIDHELKLSRLNNGQVGGFCAARILPA